ncbi:adenylate cyclase [Lentzea sp. NBRC 105346]|uniref:FAD/NAD(P)-binding protein n=1 Tax=Lentzea sp. NBRC 105346 TaxID=3032205 RepID=UPI0024A42543|nr:FAD/NAD(P)-binding protein [Lentzea sp. NBRC 105346]GLZ29972.1 adenylate cyclase [Lentzea sp. NBRC 105346]
MGVLVVVGGGPRAAGLIERIGANASLFDGPLEIHVVDPFPAGAGRVWRHEQSPLLRMNSMAEDVTMFTDESFAGDGPVVPGPSLAEWNPGLEPTSFPSRQVQSAYLAWFFEHVVNSLPDNISVRVHRNRAVRLSGRRVCLDDGFHLDADVVVLALGHLDAEIEPEHRELLDHAWRHGLFYLPPAYSADADLSAVSGDVVLRGFGLAFIDLMVLLTEGRGGRFVDGRYIPSGREPRIHVGSRRGVPYHSKTGYRLQGARPDLPRFFAADVVEPLLTKRLDFRAHVWPLLAKEIAWGYYHELFTGHPEHVDLELDEFVAAYAKFDWYSDEMRALIERAVPDPGDRIDFERLDRPLDGLTFSSGDDFQSYLRDYVRADIDRRSDPRHSADLGAFMALLSVFGQLPRVVPCLEPASRLRDADGWWYGFFSYLASGPPPDRLEQLLALSEAGVVRFLGADMWVEAVDGGFLAGSATTPDVVRASGLIEARLPVHSLSRTEDPVLRGLHAAGEIVEEVLDDGVTTGLVRVSAEGRLIDSAGREDPFRFALGPYTTGRAFAAFARPRTNAPAFRQNDVIARAILCQLGRAPAP